MKEYLKPKITLIEFDERDVLVVSGASAFDIGWLNFDVVRDTSTSNEDI